MKNGVNKKIIYPGTFDPVSNGHINLISRIQSIFNTVIIAIPDISNKSCLLTIEERVDIVQTLFLNHKEIEVKVFSGLLVDFAYHEDVHYVLRGLRSSSDFEYESKMGWMNEQVCHQPNSFKLETIFLMSDHQHRFISSSLIKEIYEVGGSISHFVPQIVSDKLDKIRSINY